MVFNNKASVFYSVRIAAIAAIGGFLFGFDMAAINSSISAIQNKFATGAWQTGFSVSIVLVGAAIGAFFGARLSDSIGRVKCMKWAAFLFFCGSIGAGAAFGFYEFIWWRFITGLAIGGANIVIPRYIAETAPSQYRGRLGTFQQLAIVLGILAANIIFDVFAEKMQGAPQTVWLGFENWNWMFWIKSVPAVIYGLLLFSIPESPYFLMMKQKVKEALQVLMRTVSEDKAHIKLDEIKEMFFVKHKAKFSDLFGKNVKGKTRLYPAVLAGISIAVLQQLVGVNVIFYYGNSLWQSVGFTAQDSSSLSTVTSVLNVLATVAAIFLIDKKGRKPLLMAGSAGMFISLLVMAISFANAPLDANLNPVFSRSLALTTVIAANLFIVFFAMTWGPVLWVMLGEMFNNKIRGVALSMAGLAQWLANFTVSTTFPPLTENLGLSWTYGIYAFVAIFAFFFVLNNVKETAGKELEEM